MKFKIGDKVKIKNKDWYGYKKVWVIEHIFRNGDFRLRNFHDEDITIERYEEKDLKKVK